MKKTINPKNIQTLLNHPERFAPKESNPSLIAPIYQSAKFVVDPNMDYGDQYIYSRIANPTIASLENSLSKIQGKEDTIVFSSGIAAISNFLLSYLKAGDHVISFNELYKPARIFIRDLLKNYGVSSTVLDLGDWKSLEEAIIEGKTKLIHFESPTNPNLSIVDIKRLTTLAHSKGVKVSMDSTFCGLHQNSNFEVDFLIQSLTKYANGHGDILAGSLSGKKSDITQIRAMTSMLGACLDAHSAFLIERGLRTYGIRYTKHSENAFEIAKYLVAHPKVQKVYYPGLPEHENHELAKQQMKEMGGVVSFILKDEDAISFCKKLKLIQFSVSIGSTESIIAPTEIFFGSDLSPSKREQMGISYKSLRLSVGLEDIKDLIEDLETALY